MNPSTQFDYEGYIDADPLPLVPLIGTTVELVEVLF